MAAIRTPRQAWVDAGLRALAAGGPEAVRVEALARDLGVTKGGFYWHFDDRAALLAAMLDAWERVAVDEAMAVADTEAGGGRAKLGRLFGLAAASGDLRRTDLAVRDWARRDKAVSRRLKRVDNRRIDYLRSLFRQFCADDDEVEARSLTAMALFVGPYFLATDHPGRGRADAVALAAQRLLA